MKNIDAVLIGIGVLMGSAGAICLKYGAVKTHVTGWSLEQIGGVATNPYIVLGLALYFVPAAIWIYLLGRWPVSMLQPILSLTYVCTPLLALWLLGEPVSPSRWLGIAVIISGVFIVARS